MPKITVVGSINMDLVTQSPRFPKVGETLLGTGFKHFMGGKGANQAVAAARLGAEVNMIGAIGNDHFGHALLNNLKKEGVHTQAIRTFPNLPTGIANITVAEGDNHIIVVSGANFGLTPADIEAQATLIAEADVILSQLEIPINCVIAAAKIAKQYNKPFILNPAPAQKLPTELLELVTILTPNAYELAISLGQPENTPAETLIAQAPCQVVMTRGSEGALYSDEHRTLHSQASYKVQPVDTTGAGDTFNAALACFREQGLATAVQKACAAAAISVTQHGAQGGMPTSSQLNNFLQQTQYS